MKLVKKLDQQLLQKINDRIVEKTRHITDLPNLHDDKAYTPFAIDEGDHASVAYSGGFINISYDNLEDGMSETGRPKPPKFNYGKFNEATNVLITKLINNKHNQETAQLEGEKLVDVTMKLNTKKCSYALWSNKTRR